MLAINEAREGFRNICFLWGISSKDVMVRLEMDISPMIYLANRYGFEKDCQDI